MARKRSVFVCQNCGHKEPKWMGRCASCGTWSSLVEETEAPKASARGAGPVAKAQALNDIAEDATARTPTGLSEFDRVLGGGLVPGALVLVGGDPGIGKSTLLLQTAGRLADSYGTVLYLSAEESAAQVKLRASRLGVDGDRVYLLADTTMEALQAACDELKPKAIVLDSIQTVGVADVQSPIGSVSQIRAVTQALMTLAKGRGIATFVVGHVTKEGAIAGPRVMEHMVDTVLYFEGDRSGPYRLLRAHKNRFGSAQEVGVFEMTEDGLIPVSNPSQVFLSQRAQGPGAAVVTSLEGSRPLLLEVQALTNPCLHGNPRRVTVGCDQQRIAMLCAVLERHGGLALSGMDVYVNVAGGVRIVEPGADLGFVAALASAVRGCAIADDIVVLGEVGLSGEVRAAGQLASRLAEAESLGFRMALVPASAMRSLRGAQPSMQVRPVAHVREALEELDLVPRDGMKVSA